MTQEVSCKIIRTVLDFARHKGGEKAVERIVEVAGVPYDVLADENAWIDHDIEKRIFRELDGILDMSRAAFHCGEHGVRSGSFGSLEVLARALLRPRNVYARLPYLANRVAKVGKMKVVDLGPQSARVQYRYGKEFESIPEICDNRQGMLAALPLLWGLPPAVIDEDECSAKGGEMCDYRIRWLEPVEDRLRLRCALIGGLLGAGVLGAVAERVLLIGWLGGGATAALLVIAGWIVGDTWDQAREMKVMRGIVAQQNEKLAQQLVSFEKKVREVEDLNHQLAGQVGERTSELEAELRRLRRLTELSCRITTTLDATAIVDLTIGSLADLFHATGWLLAPSPTPFDRGDESGSPVPLVTALQGRELDAARRAADELLAESDTAATPGTPDTPDTAETLRATHRAARFAKKKQALTMLLASSGDPLGTLTLVRHETHGPFGPRDVELCRLLADILVGALVNARLIERAKAGFLGAHNSGR